MNAQEVMRMLWAQLLKEGSILIFNGVTVSVEQEGKEKRYYRTSLGEKVSITRDEANALLRTVMKTMLKEARRQHLAKKRKQVV